MSVSDNFGNESDLGLIQESPLPEDLPNKKTKRRVVEPVKRTDGVPDPNTPVVRPDVKPKRNYDSQSKTGIKQATTHEVIQGYAPQGQRLVQEPQIQQPQQQSNQQQQNVNMSVGKQGNRQQIPKGQMQKNPMSQNLIRP